MIFIDIHHCSLILHNCYVEICTMCGAVGPRIERFQSEMGEKNPGRAAALSYLWGPGLLTHAFW